MRTAKARTDTMSWLKSSPQRYPCIPKQGIARKTPAILTARPHVLMRNVDVVFPYPLIALKSAVFVYKKRTDPCQRQDKSAGGFTVEQHCSDQISENKKEKTTGQSKDEAASDRFLKQLKQRSAAAGNTCGADSRHQDGSYRIGDGRRKEDAGERHSCEDAVETYGFRSIHAVKFQAGRDRGGLYALQQGDDGSVRGQRKRLSQQQAQAFRYPAQAGETAGPAAAGEHQ